MLTITYKFYSKYIFNINKLRILKLKMLGAKIAPGVKSYGRFTIVNFPNLDIGERSIINEGVHINCRSKVTIGKDVHLFDSENNMIRSESGKTILVKGLKDYILVETDKALLLCPKADEQSIKQMLAEIKA